MQIQKTNFGTESKIKCGFYRGKYVFPNHIHQFSEFIYVTSGEVNVTVNGRTYSVKKGDFAIISPFATHDFFTPEYCEIWICVVSNDFLTDIVSSNSLYNGRESAVFTPTHGLTEYIKDRLIDNNQEFLELDEKIICHFKALLHAIYNDYVTLVPNASSSKISNALMSMLLYIKEHAKEDLTRESVANALGYHPAYLSRCLNSIEGMNFRKMLNSARIEHAKEMLVNTSFKIIDIACECGFSAERSFHRAFIETTGCTPGAYRKARKNK